MYYLFRLQFLRSHLGKKKKHLFGSILFNGLLHAHSVLKSSQVTYEVQPPSYTSLKLLSGPPRGGGGDTLWSSQYAIYDLLSPGMQTYLEGLEALHSARIQADGSNALGRTVRRDPIVTKHPLIRTVSINLQSLLLSFSSSHKSTHN